MLEGEVNVVSGDECRIKPSVVDIEVADGTRPAIRDDGIPICGAMVENNVDRNGGFCQLPQGTNTAHVGYGRCSFHGGAVPRSSGRYSRLRKHQMALAELIEEHERDPNPLDLLPDLAAARAIFVDYVQNYTTVRDALLAWHDANMKACINPPHLTLPDFDVARKMLETIGGTVARIEKINMTKSVSRADFVRCLNEWGRIVNRYVPDEVTRGKIESEIRKMRIHRNK